MIAYAADPTVAVVDPDHAGRRVRDVVPYLATDAPIVATVARALRFAPTSLLIGIAPPGGALPPDWRAEILAALDAGSRSSTGCTTFSRDPELRAAADARERAIWDVRMPPPAPLFSGARLRRRGRVVLTVGSDCAVGKMTAALELTRAARERGVRARFVPTGQTGIAIAGWGTRSIASSPTSRPARPSNSSRGDRARRATLLFVEGQGGIAHPAYAPVTLALLFGCAPDALVLVHLATRTKIEGYDIPICPYRALIRTYEGLCADVKPARVVGDRAEHARARRCGRARGDRDARARKPVCRATTWCASDRDALYAAIAPQIAEKTGRCARRTPRDARARSRRLPP